MTADLTRAPQHAELDEERVATLRRHLVGEIAVRRDRRARARGPLLVAAAALLVLALASGGYAIGQSVFDLWSSGPSDPRRIGERVEIAAEREWSLQAWKSTRGICMGVTLDGEAAFSGCGMPVIGAPPDTVHTQPLPEHVIGLMMAGGDGGPSYVTGPISPGVTRVAVEIADGRVLEAAVYPAPSELESQLSFYFVRIGRGGPTRARPARAVIAYDRDGRQLERLAPPSPAVGVSG